MTNREWLNNLNNKAMAAELLPPNGQCEYCIINEICDHITGICINKLVEWLQQEHIEPMPKIEEGDCIIFQEGSNLYRAICVYENVIYSLVSGKFHIFDGKIKEDTVAIQSYNVKTGNFEDIWRRVDNEEK